MASEVLFVVLGVGRVEWTRVWPLPTECWDGICHYLKEKKK